MRQIIIGALRLYKWGISPLLPSACRFHPTCSEYMMEAVARYGALRGVAMGLRRLLRCHPFHAGGVDPVPQRQSGNTRQNPGEPLTDVRGSAGSARHRAATVRERDLQRAAR